MTQTEQTEFQRNPLEQISPSKANPRGTFEATSLKELADSIRQKGVIQPITVCPATGQTGKPGAAGRSPVAG